jgi:hypothetical protein
MTKEELCKKIKDYITDEAAAYIEYEALSEQLKALDEFGAAAAARLLARDERSHEIFLSGLQALLKCFE